MEDFREDFDEVLLPNGTGEDVGVGDSVGAEFVIDDEVFVMEDTATTGDGVVVVEWFCKPPAKPACSSRLLADMKSRAFSWRGAGIFGELVKTGEPQNCKAAPSWRATPFDGGGDALR